MADIAQYEDIENEKEFKAEDKTAVKRDTIKVFSNYIRGHDLQKALDFARDNPFSVVFKEAQKGNVDAVDFIFHSCKKQIAAAFWRYFLGGPKASSKTIANRLEAGDADVFAAEVYAMLKDTEGTNPLLTWDISLYVDLPETEQLKLLGYYVYTYCENLAFNLLEANPEDYGYTKKRGVKDSLPNATSYDALTDQGVMLEDPNETTASEYETQSVIDNFLILLKTSYPELYPIVKLKADGLTIKEIMKKTEITVWIAYQALRDAKKIYKEFTKAER